MYRIAAKYSNKSVFQHWFKERCRMISWKYLMPQHAHDQGASNATFGWRIWCHLAKLHVCEVLEAFEYLEVIRYVPSVASGICRIEHTGICFRFIGLACYRKKSDILNSGTNSDWTYHKILDNRFPAPEKWPMYRISNVSESDKAKNVYTQHRMVAFSIFFHFTTWLKFG